MIPALVYGKGAGRRRPSAGLVLCIFIAAAGTPGCSWRDFDTAPPADAFGGGPLVVVPALVDDGEDVPLRSVMAWPGKETILRTPAGIPDCSVVVSVDGDRFTVTDIASGRRVSGVLGGTVRLEFDGGLVVEMVVERP